MFRPLHTVFLLSAPAGPVLLRNSFPGNLVVELVGLQFGSFAGRWACYRYLLHHPLLVLGGGPAEFLVRSMAVVGEGGGKGPQAYSLLRHPLLGLGGDSADFRGQPVVVGA